MLANDSVTVTPGTGATVATELIGGKEHQVVLQADASGHIVGTLPTYLWATPGVAVGASKLYLDLFNAAGSGKVIDVRAIFITPKLDVAVVGALGIRVDLYRTNAVGTGGTSWNYRSPTIDVAGGSVTPMDTSNAAIPAQITGRHLPAGGATIDDWMFPTFSAGEETATSMAYFTQHQNLLPTLMWGQRLAIREGEGLLLKQGTVAATGTLSFLVAFTVE